MTEEYRQKEQEFMDRHDSLCEDVPLFECDCSKCPTKDLCDWLCANAYSNERKEAVNNAKNQAEGRCVPK